MSERGNFRGGRGGRGDRGGRGSSSTDRGGRGGSQAASGEKKKENILDLTKYMDKEITVKFSGGREGGRSLRSLLWQSLLMTGQLRELSKATIN